MKRAISLLLAIVMVIGMLPMPVTAQALEAEAESAVETALVQEELAGEEDILPPVSESAFEQEEVVNTVVTEHVSENILHSEDAENSMTMDVDASEESSSNSNTITINAPVIVDSTLVTISGKAPANTDVSIYLNENFAGNTISDAYGNYILDVSLGALEQSQSFMAKAECLGSDGKTYSAAQGIYFRYFVSPIQEIRFYGDSESEEYLVLNASGETVDITYTESDNPYKFEVLCDQPEEIGNLYITSTVDNVKKYMDAIFNEETGTFIAVGYFDESDRYYKAGTINVEYTLKANAPAVGESVDWGAFNNYISDELAGATVRNSNFGGSSYGTVDFSNTISDLENVTLEYAISCFDEENDTDLGTVRSYYKTGNNVLGYIVPGLDDSRYYAYLDYSDPKTLKVLIDDGLDVASKAVELEMGFAELLDGTNLNANYLDLDNAANFLSKAGTAVSVAGDMYNIHQDMNSLREKIENSDSIQDKTAAYAAVDELEMDQIAFALAVTVLPILVTGGAAMPAAATLFTGIIGAMSAASDVVYQHRGLGIIEEGIATNWYENVTRDIIQVGDNAFCEVTNLWYEHDNGWWYSDYELLIYGTGATWNRLDKYIPNSNITKMTISPGITEIGHAAFAEFRGTGLASISIPNTVEIIGSYSFWDITDLVTITLSNSVKVIGDFAFIDCINLSNVSLGNGLTELGSGVFLRCESLKAIVLPPHLESVGYGVFEGCSINAITIPKSVKNAVSAFHSDHIPSTDWHSCGFLTGSGVSNVRFEVGSTSIPDMILYCAEDVESVIIPSDVESIGASAFSRCTSLQKISLPEGVKYIGDSAFGGCEELSCIELSDDLVTIDDFAFLNTSLEEITIPASTTDVKNGYAFFGMDNLKNINVDITNPNFSSINGVLFDKEYKTLLKYPGTRTEYYRIPDGVETIAKCAFSECYSRNNSLIIPESVNLIESSAFSCYGIDANYDVDPEYVAEIYFRGERPFIISDAFDGASVKMFYPKGFESWNGIEKETFAADEISWTPYIPDGNVEIEQLVTSVTEWENALSWANVYSDVRIIISSDIQLKTDYLIPTNVTVEISNEARLSVAYNATITNNGTVTASSKGRLHIIGNWIGNVPQYAESLAFGTFGNNFVWELFEDDCLVVSGTGAMPDFTYDSSALPWAEYVDQIATIIVEEGITYLGEYVFCFYPRLESLFLPASLADIGWDALNSNFNLQEIHVAADSETYTSENGILLSKDKSTLLLMPIGKSTSEIQIPDTVTTLAEWSMAYNFASEIIIPEGITNIESYALFNCMQMTKISLPSTLSFIDSSAYNACRELTDVTVHTSNPYYCTVDNVLFTKDMTNLIACPAGKSGMYIVPDNVRLIGVTAFDDCAGLKEIILPDDLEKIGGMAFSNCSGLTNITIPAKVSEIDFYAFSFCENLTTIKFTGNAPILGEGVFEGITAEVLYPSNNPTWTAAVMQDYEGNITWVPYGEAHEHTEVVDTAVEPTCTETGLTEGKHCSECGEILIAQEVIPALGHTWNEGVVTKEPTEQETGIRTYTCTVCGETKTEEIPVLEHQHVYVDEVTAPTCTYKGYTVHKCACGDSYVDSYVDKLEHSWDAGKVTTEATCTEAGEKTYTCQACGETRTEEIPAFGHSYEADITEPTCTEQGYTTHTCTCGDSYVDSYVNALYHTYENGYCTRCGAEDPDYVGTITGSCGENLTWTLYDGTLTISGTGEMYSWRNGETADDAPWYEYRGEITKVVIENGVASIGQSAFDSCEYITEVSISDTVTTISPCAFWGCLNLASITIPEGVHSIGVLAFYGCMSLTTVTIPASVEEFSFPLFGLCNSLTEINVREGNPILASVDGVLFNKELTLLVEYPAGKKGSYVIPDTVKDIGIPFNFNGQAFSGCTNLTEVTIPGSVESIGIYTFSGCTSLTGIYFKGDAPLFADEIFHDVTATAYYPAGNETWTVDVMQNYGGTITWVPYEPDLVDSGTWGENLTWKLYEDGTLIFSGEGEMQDSEDVEDYPWYSQYREDITTAILEEGITSIGRFAFANTYINKIVTPSSLKKIGEAAFFMSCLAEANLAEGLERIENNAFMLMTCLKEITIPSTVTYIGTGQFAGTVLESLTFKGDAPEFGPPDGNVDIFSSVTATVYYPADNETWTPEIMQQYGGTITWVPYGDVHEHTEVIDAAVEPTCTETGLTEGKHCSECGEILVAQEEIPALGHTWNEGVVTKEPTEQETGIRTYTCTVCGETKTEEIPVLEHQHVYVDEVTAPTCKHKGYTVHKCACGDSYVDSYVDKLEHSWDAGKVTTEATCTEVGEKTYTCQACGETRTEEIPAPGHSYETVITEPSCTAKGYTTHTCSSCGDSYVDTYVDPLGHTWNEGVVTKEPTEQETGIRTYTCTVCGETKTEEIPVLEHQHVYVDEVTAPTCTYKGYTVHKCACGDSYVDSYVDKLEHSWDAGKVTTEATCTEAGVKTYTCQACGETRTEEIPAFGHSYEADITEPTCTEQGYTTHTCTCGDSYVDTYVDPLGHDYQDGICSVCGDPEGPILASGTHGSTGTWELTKDGTLTISGTGDMGNCGNIKRPWMDYRLDVKKVIIEEGITDIGTYAFHQFHNLEEVEIPSTVTSIKELAFNWCKNLKSITLPEGLKWIDYAGISYCKSLERITIPGSVTFMGKAALSGCEQIKEIYFEGNAPRTGQDGEPPINGAKMLAGVTATAYYPANNETWTEDVMKFYGGTITWVPYGDAHEHTEVIDAAVEPTCTETGLTEGKHCSECGEVLVAQEEIPALGHSYEEGKCTVCGEADPNYSAAEKIASGWSGDLTWVLTDDGVLTFSGTGAMKNYGYKSEMPWYKYIDQVTSVVLNEGVTRIGDYAFYGMTKLETIDIADTVTYIGDFSFKGSTALDGVVLPPNLSNLGTSAFYGCTGLTSIEIPASLYTVKPYAFKNCSSLAKVTFHEGNLMKLSDGSFYGTALTEVEFPKCLDIIDVYCFKNCFDLASITIPQGDLTQVREAVFYGTAIPSITVPEGVTKVGPYAFKNCVNLKTVSLPTTLTSVGEASFYACTGLQGITIPDAVTSIGDYAFRKCAAMTEVNLGRELTDIGLCAFYGCSGLTNLEIPDKVTTIQGYAFKGCTGLTSVKLGNSVETLGESAFHTCTALKTLELPASLKTIGDYCFSGSYNLWQLNFTGNAPTIGSGAFKGMDAYAYYPANDSTWTSAVMQNYGGDITWKAAG